MELMLKRAFLRPWRPEDAEDLVRHANNRRIWLNLRDGFPHPYTADDADRWLGMANAQQPARHFAIVIEGEAAGGIGLLPKEDVYRRSIEIGYWLGESFWGRGIATEAVSAVVDYTWQTFDVCRIYAGVFDYNKASARVLEKTGFTFEARLRESVTKDGRTADELIYAMVR
ncbi:MAG TPA: GNAT family N-acetyltransferase [Pirellulales bacterium]